MAHFDRTVLTVTVTVTVTVTFQDGTQQTVTLNRLRCSGLSENVFLLRAMKGSVEEVRTAWRAARLRGEGASDHALVIAPLISTALADCALIAI